MIFFKRTIIKNFLSEIATIVFETLIELDIRGLVHRIFVFQSFSFWLNDVQDYMNMWIPELFKFLFKVFESGPDKIELLFISHSTVI